MRSHRTDLIGNRSCGHASTTAAPGAVIEALGLFGREQVPLPFLAPFVTGERTVGANDAMAGDDHRDAIAGARLRDRATGARHTDRFGDLRVRPAFSGRNGAQ